MPISPGFSFKSGTPGKAKAERSVDGVVVHAVMSPAASLTGVPTGQIKTGTYIVKDTATTSSDEYTVLDEARIGIQQNDTTVLILAEDIEDVTTGGIEVPAYARVVWTQRTWHNGAALSAAKAAAFSQRLYETTQ